MNRVFIIGGRSYNVAEPTIKKLSLAGKHLEKEIEKVNNKDTFEEIFNEISNETLCKVLSCLISGDLSLVKELSFGEKNELVEPLCVIYEDREKDMERIMQIARQICLLTAKPRIQ